MDKRRKVEALLDKLSKRLDVQGMILCHRLIVERLKILGELKVLGRVAEDADPIFTEKVGA
jgi:hypothetical protein